MQNSKLISVVIATFNRSAILQESLSRVLKQRTDYRFNYEVIVIDNNSNDQTKDVIYSHISSSENRIKYLFERKQGKTFALNKGLSESAGEIIAFLDDDCFPTNTWLLKIYESFYLDSQIDGALGRVNWEDGKPFYRNSILLRGNIGNSCFKSSVFKEIGMFDTLLGPGSIGSAAEDMDFIYRLIKKGKKIVINDEMLVIHKHRVSIEEQLKVSRRDCKGYVIFLLKYILRYFDKECLKKIYWFLTGIFDDLNMAVRERNKCKIKLKICQLQGAFIGLIKGAYIWLILSNFKKNAED